MLKKSLFAIALVGLLASMAMAGDDVQVRAEGCTWPWIKCYKPYDICRVPVWIKVGYYVKIDKCNGLKIMMQPTGADYAGCVDFGITSNFNMVIGARIEVLDSGKAFQSDLGKWSAWIDGGGTIRQKAGKHETHKLCAKVKEPNPLAIGDPVAHDELKVAYAFITVKPQCTSGGNFDGFSVSGNPTP